MYEILNTVKKLNKSNLEYGYSIEDIRNYYNVPQNTVKTILKRNRKEFEYYREVITVKGEDLKQIKSQLNVHPMSPSASLFNIEGVIRTGLMLQDNVISEKIKELIIETGVPEIYKSVFQKNHRTLLKQYKLFESLKEAFNGLCKIDKQVFCGKYKIDIVVDNRIAIECDEYGHLNYNVEKEKLRESYIISQGYKLIRYNPDGEDSIFELINRILNTYKVC